MRFHDRVQPAPPREHRALLTYERDEVLAQLARDGDQRAFEVIVERYRPLLLAHCRRVAGEAAAQDALQRALLSAWYSLHRRIEVRHVRAWLFAIANNAALEAVRDTSAHNRELPEPVGDGRSAHEHFEHAERAREALAAVAQLPQRERDALVWASLHGLSGREIANELGVGEGVVRQLVWRARERARTRLTALLPPFGFLRVRALFAAVPRHSDVLARRSLGAAEALASRAGLAPVLAAGVLAGATFTALATHPRHRLGKPGSSVVRRARAAPSPPPATRASRPRRGVLPAARARSAPGASRLASAPASTSSTSTVAVGRAVLSPSHARPVPVVPSAPGAESSALPAIHAPARGEVEAVVGPVVTGAAGLVGDGPAGQLETVAGSADGTVNPVTGAVEKVLAGPR